MGTRLGLSSEHCQALSKVIDKHFGINKIIEILDKFKRRDSSTRQTASFELLKLIQSKGQIPISDEILSLSEHAGMWNNQILEQRQHQGNNSLFLHSHYLPF